MVSLPFPSPAAPSTSRPIPDLDECLGRLPCHAGQPETLPFTAGDTTAGCENELQVAVFGSRQQVDLPRTIEESSYFANLIRHTLAGDTPPQARRNLERYLADNPGGVWENSWVRLPLRLLCRQARQVLAVDLLADKANPAAGRRTDTGRFFLRQDGEEWLRVPVSYLLKLALADVVHALPGKPAPLLRRTAERLMSHLLSDNTSPETFSFHVLRLSARTGYGQALARETGKRFLATQLLLAYANQKFALTANGQRATVFFSPHPPIRQRQLNNCISDAFYRELFMSPCLSGWDRGEQKHRYMVLCHQVLSRSQLNAVMKLREAGIITNNLVVLPHTSTISLANNGTHVSLGSRKLTALLADPTSGFTPRHEKYLGDLAAKVMEHFLPLFVGTYSGAPYRLDFEEFHPERTLGFLPHQLDYTHLRMLWRRWKGKARNRFCGHACTPFGPQLLDRLLGRVLQLKGDWIPDFRLIDYPLALLSTGQSGGQDGRSGNEQRLKRDLETLGVFDQRLSLYLPCKLREFQAMGFSGFEARYYSQFEHFQLDMARAVDLQMLLHALAFKYMLERRVDHHQIPDSPFVESERRQILFGAALEIPTFFVHRRTPNRFLAKILARVAHVRPSRRYPGYLRIPSLEYRLTLLKVLQEDGASLIELLGLKETLADLENRLRQPENGAVGRLMHGILASAGIASPFAVAAREFNLAAEGYYREELRRAQLLEAWQYLAEDIHAMASNGLPLSMEFRQVLASILGSQSVEHFLAEIHEQLLADRLDRQQVARLIHCLLLAEDLDAKRNNA